MNLPNHFLNLIKKKIYSNNHNSPERVPQLKHTLCSQENNSQNAYIVYAKYIQIQARYLNMHVYLLFLYIYVYISIFLFIIYMQMNKFQIISLHLIQCKSQHADQLAEQKTQLSCSSPATQTSTSIPHKPTSLCSPSPLYSFLMLLCTRKQC